MGTIAGDTRMKKIQVFYFSGTGNTGAVVKPFVGSVREKGFDVTLTEINSDTKAAIEQDSIIGLFFPANSQSVSRFIRDFFVSLPQSSSATPVFAVCTLNESVAVGKFLKSALVKKGYRPFLYSRIRMPNNFMTDKFDEAGDEERLGKLPEEINRLVDGMVQLKGDWASDNGNRFVGFLGLSTPLLWWSMRLMLQIETDSGKCPKCGLCAKKCPVQNIEMHDFPVHLNHCDMCMRCIAHCPDQAKGIRGSTMKIRKSPAWGNAPSGVPSVAQSSSSASSGSSIRN